jgi:CheY-like chemotaxis protein
MPSGQGLVLVMDDDEMVRRVAGSMLVRLGYESVLTGEGAEALVSASALVAEGKPLVAALLDLTVRSGQGGREIVSALRELSPRLAIIACSGYTDDPAMADPTRFGFSGSLRKPFLLSELSKVLADLIAGG